MMRILEIVGDTILFGFLLGFVGWLFWRALKRSDEPARLIFKWVITIPVIACFVWVIMPTVRNGGLGAVAGIIAAVVFGNLMVIVWGHSIIDIVANPIASLYTGGNEPPEPKPCYSVARARRMRREFLEAVVAVREQLALFPNDMEGVMFLAAIQAEDLKDLPSAEMTLNLFCDRPEAPPKQVAAAMNQLADWHIRLAQDFDSARATFDKIITRFPDTELALQAAQRIAHLGGTEKQLLASHDHQPMAVPEGIKNIGVVEIVRAFASG